MNYAPKHVETLKSNPHALSHYHFLIAQKMKPAEAFKKALRMISPNVKQPYRVPNIAMPADLVQEGFGRNAREDNKQVREVK